MLVAAGFYILHLHKELKRVQEARVDDAKKVTDTLMSLTKEWQTLLERLSSAVEKLEAPRRR